MKIAVIFGGTGFIGTFFCRYLLEEEGFEKIYLYDNDPLSIKESDYRQNMLSSYSSVYEVRGDVCKKINWIPPESISLIANFSATHREPGHLNKEYYETNLLGAENVCDWAEKIGCKKIMALV